MRKPTARQLYLAGLVYHPVAVDRNGQVQRNTWKYGSPTTQQALLAHHGTGRCILLGRDPDDFSAPALAFDADGNLICEGIEAVKAGAYGSVDGIREAARNKKAAKTAVDAAKDANDYLDREALNTALAQLDAPEAPQGAGTGPVVMGHFKSPLKTTKRPAKKDREPAVPEEFLRNLDADIAARVSRRV